MSDYQLQSDQDNSAVGSYKRTTTQLTIKPNVDKIDVKLFVGQIPKAWSEDDVTTFFSKFGEIIESQIIRDSKTNSHKGCAFVKFASITKADEAMNQIKNVHLPGANAPIQLKWADGEQERLGLAGVDEKQQTKLFVGSIPKNVTEDNLMDIFSQYGKIEELHLMKEPDNSSKGCAFIKYELKESALLAIRRLNAQGYIQDSNKPLEVRFADKKKVIPQTTQKLQQSQSNLASQQQQFKQQQMAKPFDMMPMDNLYGQLYMKNPWEQMYQKYYNNYAMMASGPMMPIQQKFININDLSEGNPAYAKKQGPSGANLFIFHLPNDWKESDLYGQFQHFGNIISARIMTEKNTKKSKGFGFISYDKAESARLAIDSMNGFQVAGKRLKVQLKKGDDESDKEDIPKLADMDYKPY